MTEQRPTYLPLQWQVTASFNIYPFGDKRVVTQSHVFDFEARDATAASGMALAEIRKMIPGHMTVFNLSVVASLIPEQNQESDLTTDS